MLRAFIISTGFVLTVTVCLSNMNETLVCGFLYNLYVVLQSSYRVLPIVSELNMNVNLEKGRKESIYRIFIISYNPLRVNFIIILKFRSHKDFTFKSD